MVGKTFGQYTVLLIYRELYASARRPYMRARAQVQCSCGKVFIVQPHHLLSGISTKCKPCNLQALAKGRSLIPSSYIGKTVNGVQILKCLGKRHYCTNLRMFYECKCHCGKVFEWPCLHFVKLKSCGCLRYARVLPKFPLIEKITIEINEKDRMDIQELLKTKIYSPEQIAAMFKVDVEVVRGIMAMASPPKKEKTNFIYRFGETVNSSFRFPKVFIDKIDEIAEMTGESRNNIIAMFIYEGLRQKGYNIKELGV